MAEPDLNPKQRLARDTRGREVIVAAAAGSGKTQVLTERLMRYVCDSEHPKDIDSFLVITYTRAAAAELKSRITGALGEKLEEQPENRLLRHQLALSRKAHIQTIHGFCADVLREYGHKLGISPDFKIIEDEQAAMMKASALDEVIEEHYAAPEKHPGFRELVDSLYNNRKDIALNDSVLSAYEKMQSHAFPMEWAHRQLQLLNTAATDAAQTPWGKEIIENAYISAEYWGPLVKKYYEIVKNNENNVDPKGKLKKSYGETLSKLDAAFDEIIKAYGEGKNVWNRIAESVNVEFPKLGRGPSTDCDVGLIEEFKPIITESRKEIGRLVKLFSASSDTLLKGIASTAPAVQALVNLVGDFTDRFSEEKRRLGFLDYSDLEHQAVRLLITPDGNPTDVARELSGHFTEILVDEFQDVSEVQNAIVSSVSKNGTNLFTVGDVKQSIYSFRLANPDIFTGKCRESAEINSEDDLNALPPGSSVAVFMNSNYRSRREVIDGINAVFECCMSKSVGDVDYSGGEKLNSAADYYEGSVPAPQLIITDKKSYAGTGKRPADIEAENVAAEIRKLVENGIEPKDIAILMRSKKAQGEAFAAALRKQGIPVSSDGGSGFFESDEILALTSLLSIIDNPHKDIDVLSVFRYPVFGFTPDELAGLRKADKRGNLHAALLSYAKENEKAREFSGLLGRFRALASEITVSQLIWTVMDDTEFIPVSCALPGGETRRQNLLQLASMAEDFDASGNEGLHKFLLWLKKRREGNAELSFGGSAGEGVKLMTIHKSKGLGFPVVFVVGLGGRFNSQDSREPVLVHSGLGFGVKVVDRERHVAYPTLCRNAINLRMSRERVSEELRVLYVALTRAKERLFLSALADDSDGLWVKYEEELSRQGAVEKTIEPSVKKTDEEPEVKWSIAAYLAGKKESYLPWLMYTAVLESINGRHRLTVEIRKRPEEAEPSGNAEEMPEAAEDGAEETGTCSEELISELERHFSFGYPFAVSTGMPSKITATAVKDPYAARDETDPDESITLDFARPDRSYSFRIPSFEGEERPLSAAETGTATHAVLQYIDFDKTGSLETIESEITRLQEKGCITARQARAVSRPMLMNFFASETGKRIVSSAGRVKREFRFSVLTPPERLGLEAGPDPVLLQGVADCCIVDPDGLVIIDYKTDRTKDESELEEKTRVYSTQLRVYADALCRIFNMPVKECILYFLRSGAERKISPENA